MNPAARLAGILQKHERTLIGLMSGMSMDGVDLAYIRVRGSYPHLAVEVLGTGFRPYGDGLRERLARGTSCSVAEVSSLGFVVAEEFAACVRDFLQKRGLSASDVDAIGSHGQTLFHATRADEPATTLQVGHPSIIAERTGILTVGNFRVRDVAVGGQGAPLVPLADYLLYRRDDKTGAVNNLGSISNVTVVAPRLEDVLAFDTGPANMAIDFFARRVPGSGGIDRDGAISAGGKCLDGLLRKLMALPFFRQPPPKAAGYGDFGPPVLAALSAETPDARPEDLVRTAVELAALTLRDAYRGFILPRYPDLDEVFFSGGGAHNPTLMRRIRECLPELKVNTFDPAFSDAKEAVCFALLANETLSGRAGNVHGATGAEKRAVLGEIAL